MTHPTRIAAALAAAGLCGLLIAADPARRVDDHVEAGRRAERANDAAAAMRAYQDAVALAAASFGADAPHGAAALLALGRCQRRAGQPELAAATLGRCFQVGQAAAARQAKGQAFPVAPPLPKLDPTKPGGVDPSAIERWAQQMASDPAVLGQARRLMESAREDFERGGAPQQFPGAVSDPARRADAVAVETMGAACLELAGLNADRGRHLDAERGYWAVTDAARQTGPAPAQDTTRGRVAEAFAGLSRLYGSAGKHLLAEAAARAALEAATPGQRRQYLWGLAGTLVATRKFAEAEGAYKELLAGLREKGDSAVAASVHSQLAALYDAAGAPGRAEAAYRAALASAEASLGRDHDQTAAFARMFGWHLLMRGQAADAEGLFRRVLDRPRAGPVVARAISLNGMARAVAGQGRTEEAERLFAQVVAEVGGRPGAEEELARFRLGLAEAYLHAGLPDRAEPLLAASQGCWERHDCHACLGTVLAARSKSHRMAGRAADATAAADRAVSAARLAHDDKRAADLADLLLQLGELKLLGGQAEGAASVTEALGIRRAATMAALPVLDPDEQLAAVRDDYLSAAHAALGAASAVPAVTPAAAEWVLNSKAVTLAALFRRRLAATPAAAEAGAKGLAAVTARLQELRGQLATLVIASAEPRTADWVHALRGEERRVSREWGRRGDEVGGRATQQAYASRFVAGLIEGPHSADAAALGMAVAEERDAWRAARSPFADGAAVPGDVRESRLRLLKDVGAHASPEPPDAAGRWTELAEVRGGLPAASVLVEFVRYRPADPRSPVGHRRWQPARYAAYVVPAGARDPVRAVDIGPADPIDAAAQDLRRSWDAVPKTLARDGEPDAERAMRVRLRAVARLVLDPLRPHLGGAAELVLSPDADLWLVPWAALPLADDGPYLLERYPLRVVPAGWVARVRETPELGAEELARAVERRAARGLGVAAGSGEFDAFMSSGGRALIHGAVREWVAAANARPRPGPPVVVADPDFNAGYAPGRPQRGGGLPMFDRLPGTAAEAAAVRPWLTKHAGEPVVYRGREATEALVKALHRPRVLVLATHGFARAATPGNPDPLLNCGLLLAGCNDRPPFAAGVPPHDGVLTGLEIAALDLAGCELVVLSACQSAVGAVHSGEGVASLAQAFQAAGARAVAGTLWPVPDEETADLTAALFRHLAGGAGPAAALRQAQLETIAARRRESGAAHPYFWAAFGVTEADLTTPRRPAAPGEMP